MKHDFTGKSIKCDTWEQMLHLAKLAEEQGMQSGGFSKRWFDDYDGVYFETTPKMYFCNLQKPQEKVVTTYHDFINTLPTEVVEVTGCDGCIFHENGFPFEHICRHPKYEQPTFAKTSIKKLFTTCPLKKASLTIKLKQNDT